MTKSADLMCVDAHWMPFTANRDFKARPRIIVGAKGHWYETSDGRRVYDSFSGLWTTGLGHCHPKITEAVSRQMATLDFAMTFQMGNAPAFALAERLTAMAPAPFTRAFFTNSGSEAADTALKMAIAWHRARGDAGRTRLIGRERGYHGVGFGGISVGGIPANRRDFGAHLIPGTDHLSHTMDLSHTAFTRGQPEWGAHLADELIRLAALHDPTTIAAVIVEPVAGSTGILPPPVGYLERLRELCSRYGILLIFDEVITGFGRIGASFAAERLGVTPDIITCAKGLTNGTIPMGAVLVQDTMYDALMHGALHVPEFFHGYTYSGHPVAAAAGLAALDAYADEGSFAASRALEPLFADLLHSFVGHPEVVDVRNFGLMGAIELRPRPDAPGARGLHIHKACFWDEDLVIRNGGDTLQFSPFLDARPEDLAMTFEKVRRVIDRIG
jgi:beta-alanine--pyruvate transaminase